MKKIGLIAGNRRLPLIFAQAAREKGYSVVAVAIKGDTSRVLTNLADKMYWIGLDKLSRLFEIFRDEQVKEIVMAGQVSPHRLFSKEVMESKEIQEMLNSIKDKRADTIFGALAGRLEREGFKLLDSTLFLEDYIPKKGVLTRQAPGFDTWEDVYFGMNLAKQVAGLDIGQTVAVKGKAIVAVEALEGTDSLIRRAGKMHRGITVVKVAKPNQDNRFDVPVVGLGTIKSLIKAGAKCLAIEADKTLFIDRKDALELADKRALAIVAT
jgi:DUF1009 family protein